MRPIEPAWASSDAGDAFEVVFVCTGNRARSPLAEALLTRYAVGLDVAVRSAGTLGLRGLPPLPEAVKAGRGLGVDITSHRSLSLVDAGLDSADLVLGFEPRHLLAAAEAGARAERTFLLGELVALIAPGERECSATAIARAIVATAHARRSGRFTSTTAKITATIDDPLGKPARVMRSTAHEIDDLVRRLVVGLFAQDVA